jgi:hypothetical protein
MRRLATPLERGIQTPHRPMCSRIGRSVMGVSYTGVCHTCNVKIELPYSSYKTWHDRPPLSDVVYMLHKFATVHAGHEKCLLNNDWWCKCSDKHTEGMESLDWSVVDEDWVDAHVDDFWLFRKSMVSITSLNTCCGYEEPCRCYGP